MRTDDPLVGALQECSLHPLLMLVSKALTRAGWDDAEILDRRQAGQRSRHGGHEITCAAYLGPTPVRMIVKVARDPDGVKTRMLDELAGAVLRSSADLGLIVTPFKVSASVAAKQAGYGPARVVAMDGNALAALMRCSGIAVRPSGEPDYAVPRRAGGPFCETAAWLSPGRRGYDRRGALRRRRGGDHAPGRVQPHGHRRPARSSTPLRPIERQLRLPARCARLQAPRGVHRRWQ